MPSRRPFASKSVFRLLPLSGAGESGLIHTTAANIPVYLLRRTDTIFRREWRCGVDYPSPLFRRISVGDARLVTVRVRVDRFRAQDPDVVNQRPNAFSGVGLIQILNK